LPATLKTFISALAEAALDTTIRTASGVGTIVKCPMLQTSQGNVSAAQPGSSSSPVSRFLELRHRCLVTLVALALGLPCLLVGIPLGHDAPLHSQYQQSFSRQFWRGDLYPRWLADENKGYGSPIFLIQYPLPYFITALLRPVLQFPPSPAREGRELGVFCFLALAGAGLSARAWFRKSCLPFAATFGAIVYISSPYLLGVDLYQRAALGELAAFVWIPLALSLCHAIRPRWSSISALAIVFCLLLMSSVISAAIFTPLIIAYAFVTAQVAHMPGRRSALASAAALALGAGMAGIYIVPFAAYVRLFDVGALARYVPGLELGRFLLFINASEPPRGWMLVATGLTVCFLLWVALIVWRAGGKMLERAFMVGVVVLGTVMFVPGLGAKLILASHLPVSGLVALDPQFPLRVLLAASATASLGIFSYCRLNASRESPLLMVAASLSFLCTLPWSSVIWAAIPQLATLQFPFRLCMIATVFAAGLFAMALDWRLRNCEQAGTLSRALLPVAAIATIGIGVFAGNVVERFDRPITVQVVPARDVDLMFPTYVSPKHLPAFAARLGRSPDSRKLLSTAAQDKVIAECLSGVGTADVISETHATLRVRSQCTGDPSSIELTQLYSPLWRVTTADSREAPIVTSSPDGLLEVSLAPGAREFELKFDIGTPGKIGTALSIISLLLAGAGTIVRLRKA
jgi:hypothetical protein